MNLTKELKNDLKEIKNKYNIEISKKLNALEKELAKALAEELELACEKHQIKYRGCYGNARDAALMFVNNDITECSIFEDPSGDWDGSSRLNDFVEDLEDGEENDED